MTPSMLDTSHGAFAIEDSGASGVPLVLLHGAVGNLRVWDRVVPALGSGLRVVAVDLPAHGWTSIEPLLFPALATALVDLCDRLRLDEPVLVGHSFGGLAAVAAAARHPSHFSRVLAIDPYLSNAEIRGSHASVDGALSAARETTWPWGLVRDIEAEIDRAVDTLYSPGRDPTVLRAMLRRGYRKQPDGLFIRHPRQEDNERALIANWNLDVDRAYETVSCPLAVALAAETPWAESRRRELETLCKRGVAMVEFSCGHDIVGFMPAELATFISEWIPR